ncbi:MAG: AMP-dependent synthetase [Gammaproteobacteria bacterium]|nr:MAG: AMP-dependent synthetase [Gammaproteobacteria bacterium]
MIDHSVRDFDLLHDGFRWSIPERYNIGVDVCDRQPGDALALVCEDHLGSVARYTFGDLRNHSNRLGNALAALGVTRGDRVAVIFAQRPEAVIAHLAIYKLGAVALPLSVLFGPEALEYRLANSRACVVLTDEPRAAQVEAMRDRLPHLEHIVTCAGVGEGPFWELLAKGADSSPAVDTVADDPAMLIYTSVTTGPPKGSLNAHRCLLGNLPGFELSQNFYAQTGGLFWTPADWAWTGGLLDALLPTLHYGKPVLGYDGQGRFDPERVVDLMARHGVRNAFIPPTAMKMLMQVPDTALREVKLKAVMSAGESVGERVVEWAEQALGITVNEMWGQTEFNYLVGNCSAIMPVKLGSMGKPFAGHWVDVIDDQGRPLPDGECGELAARTGDPVQFLGYWENEAATQAKIRGEWFLTGDVGYRDAEGYLWFVGRQDDVISSAGYRIGPGEIEDCLIRHPAVAQAAVIGVPDELRGEIIKAFIVLAPGVTPDKQLTGDIQRQVKRQLAAYEYPREIEYIETLPLTTTGKVRRKELRDRDLATRGEGGV